MANRFKTEVRINDSFNGDAHIGLYLTQADAQFILEAIVSGEVVNINLMTGSSNGQVQENPAAYAQ